MVLSDYERRLKACNPKLHIKRYGASKAGIHYGNRFVCRVPQGEISAHNVWQIRAGWADQYKTQFNPKGEYRYRHLLKRGRGETARVLYTQRLIKFDDIAKLS